MISLGLFVLSRRSGTVLQSYRTFWSDVVGLVQRGERNYERN